jgi:predicted RNase H-like nuclease (RuvC/YqgF family)
LPACPVCGNVVSRKTSLFIVQSPNVDELTDSALEKKKQTPYACARCGTRFPVNVERRRYVAVSLGELKKFKSKLRRYEKEQALLKGKIARLDEDKKRMKSLLKSSKEEAAVRELENELSSLEGHVSHLKKDKEELEQRVTELSARQ